MHLLISPGHNTFHLILLMQPCNLFLDQYMITERQSFGYYQWCTIWDSSGTLRHHHSQQRLCFETVSWICEDEVESHKTFPAMTQVLFLWRTTDIWIITMKITASMCSIYGTITIYTLKTSSSMRCTSSDDSAWDGFLSSELLLWWDATRDLICFIESIPQCCLCEPILGGCLVISSILSMFRSVRSRRTV